MNFIFFYKLFEWLLPSINVSVLFGKANILIFPLYFFIKNDKHSIAHWFLPAMQSILLSHAYLNLGVVPNDFEIIGSETTKLLKF